MALEDLVGPDKFLSALVPANPVTGDPKSEGDDHLRGIKNVLLNTFPNLDAAVTVTAAQLNAVATAVVPIGICLPFAASGPARPTGWEIANGQLLDRTTYAALFAVIGETFGAGDGSTTFAVPNFQLRTPEGQLLGTVNVGDQRGAEEVTLAANQIPKLTGSYTRTDYDGQRAEARGDGYLVYNRHTSQLVSVGEDTPAAVPTVSPRLAVTYIIRAF